MTERRAPFRYRLYGLTLESDIELRGVPMAGDGKPDVVVRRTAIDDPRLADRDPSIFVNAGAHQLLAWAMVGAFRVAGDDLVEVDPNPEAPDALVALPLLGAVMATLLHRHGLLVLHASAVSVNGVAIALLGDKGAGKSTTAGALVSAGHLLLSDDIVALDSSQGPMPVVLPANAELKLWADSGEQLKSAGLTRIGRIHEQIDKTRYALAGTDRSGKLERLYILRRSRTPGTRILSTTEALSQLLRHAYMARFGRQGFGAQLTTYFEEAGQLARDGRVRVLEVPPRLDRLGEIHALVVDDLRETSAQRLRRRAEVPRPVA